MSITTRRGDQGRTQLYSGQDVSKADLPPCAVGALDEAVSVVGIARSLAEREDLRALLLSIQQAAFVVGAELATHPENRDRLAQTVDQAFMEEWDRCRDRLEAEIEMPKDFVVPGGTPVAAHLDHARTVFRRCEREAVRLRDADFLRNPNVLRWLNRMSDLLWLLARREEGAARTPREKRG